VVREEEKDKKCEKEKGRERGGKGMRKKIYEEEERVPRKKGSSRRQ
jgi:hypothetical protein